MIESTYLRVRHDVVVIVAETPRAADELAEHDVPDGVAAPPVGISALDLLGLVPALLLHDVREAPGVRIGARWGRRGFVERDLEALQEEGGGVLESLELLVDEGGGGGETALRRRQCGGGDGGGGASGGRRGLGGGARPSLRVLLVREHLRLLFFG